MKMFNKCRFTIGVLIVAAILLLFVTGCRESKPKNVILMVADGAGFEHSIAASYWEYGKAEGQIYNSFPVKLASSTFPAQTRYVRNLPGSEYSQSGQASEQQLNQCYDDYATGKGYDSKRAWKDFSYAKMCFTDSAAAATALATGSKTGFGSIGVDVDGLILENVIETAEADGKATGVVTTKDIEDATPAGFMAHNYDRMKYLEISGEIINKSAVDLVMGSGNPFYDDNGKPKQSPSFSKINKSDWEAIAAGIAGGDADNDGDNDPWTLIQERSQFQAMAEGPTPSRVLGIAQAGKTLQQLRSGNPGDPDLSDDLPYEVPLTTNVPTLKEMTMAALNVLDNNNHGFFLLVEGGAIDDASHAGQSGRMIEEYIDFERAVEAVVEWVNAESSWNDTIIIVTSDHETGYLKGPGSIKAQDSLPVINNGKGVLPGMEWATPSPPPPGVPAGVKGIIDHTNSLVPLFAKGGACEKWLKKLRCDNDPVRGAYIDDTKIGQLIKWAVSKPEDQ
jgi:alkaline phosphatase